MESTWLFDQISHTDLFKIEKKLDWSWGAVGAQIRVGIMKGIMIQSSIVNFEPIKQCTKQLWC